MHEFNLISDYSGQVDIQAKWEHIQQLIVACNAPILLLAVNRMYSTFIAAESGRKYLFRYGWSDNSTATWSCKTGSITKECRVTDVDPEYERLVMRR